MLHVGQVSGSDPGFTADLEETHGCYSEEGSEFVVGLQEGLWWVVEPEAQSGSLALRLCHQAVRHLRIFGMVAWLSDSQYQEETKQNPKISLLRHNRGNAHYSHLRHGGTRLPPPIGVSGSE